MPDPLDAELTTYAVGRWPVVVRTLVLLGAPPPHAASLATLAVARLLARCADDEWLDLDAALAAATVETWEDNRTAWWHAPAGDAGLPESRRSSTPCRRPSGPGTCSRPRRAVGRAARRRPRARAPLAPGCGLARAAGPRRGRGRRGRARLREARVHHADRRRRGRGLTVAGTVAAVALAAGALVVGLRAVDPQPAPATRPRAAHPW